MSYQRLPGARQVQLANRLASTSLFFTGCSRHISNIGRRAGGTWTPVHNCVSLDKFTYVPSVQPDAPFLFLSRVERIKGAHAAIDIARRAGRRLIIAGNYSMQGRERQYWDEEIAPHIGHNGISYAGEVDDAAKNALLGRAIALLVPIEWDEPFGIVFAEALACGTPVLSTPRGALPEIVQHGLTGFLSETAHDAYAYSRIVHTISRQVCRQTAEQYFSVRTIANDYEALYRRAIAQVYTSPTRA